MGVTGSRVETWVQTSLGEAGRLRQESNKRPFKSPAKEKGLECDITLRSTLGTGSGIRSLVFNCVALTMKKPGNLSKPTAPSHVFVHMARGAVPNIPLSSLSASPLLSTELEYVQHVCACVCQYVDMFAVQVLGHRSNLC